MRNIKLLTAFIFVMCSFFSYSQQPSCINPEIPLPENEKSPDSQWKGKRVAFLGDSMTDKKSKNTSCLYWQYLADLLGIDPSVYGINGNQWDGIYKQATKLYSEKGNDVDAIVIFAGTNDYNHNIPLGTFYSETTQMENHNGQQVMLKHRTPIMNDTTFCGRINKVMSYLKSNFPTQQIIIMTPIHRGYAKFSETNVQPGEDFSNELGLYIGTYVNVLKEAAANWSVPVIDLYALSGLYPLSDAQTRYFHDADTDRLHPNTLGNYRLAKTIQYQMLTLSATFQR